MLVLAAIGVAVARGDWPPQRREPAAAGPTDPTTLTTASSPTPEATPTATPEPTVTPTPEPTVTPTPTATPAETPTPTPTPAPTATSTPAPAETRVAGRSGPRPEGIDEIAAQVAAVRGLPYDEPLSAVVLDSAELGAYYSSLALDELEPAVVEADRRLLTTLRLIEEGTDLYEALESLYRASVIGIYVTDEETLYLAADSATLNEVERVVAAHEVAHALQDRAFDLDAVFDGTDDDPDAALAARSLIEGDAVITEQAWSLEHLSEAERDTARAEAAQRAAPTPAGVPGYLRESLFFPYAAGARFVEALLEEGGVEALDAAFEDLPTTTEQILHPEKYLTGEGATNLEITATPGASWQEGSTYTVGEFDLQQLFAPLGSDTARDLAAGWNGGLVGQWQRGEEDAVSLVLAFDTAADAAEACDAVPAWFVEAADARIAGEGVVTSSDDVLVFSCDASEVRLGIAPDAATASRIAR